MAKKPAKRIFAHVQGSNRVAYQGSLTQGNYRRRRLAAPWRTWEAPGPVTVRMEEPK